jgi:hypothetical protein
MGRKAIIWGALAFSLGRLAYDAAAVWIVAAPAERLGPWLLNAPLVIAPIATIAAAVLAPSTLRLAVTGRPAA